MTLETARRVFAALGASLDVLPKWQGADLERLMDARHAATVERVASMVQRRGWDPLAEVSYSVGERGAIDLLATRVDALAVAVFEIKTDLPRIEETIRRHEEKTRLAPKLVKARLGWWPEVVDRFLVMPGDDRLRRIVARHGRAFHGRYPSDSRTIAAWLRDPSTSAGGIWFIAPMRGTRRNELGTRAKRIRRPTAAPREHG